MNRLKTLSVILILFILGSLFTGCSSPRQDPPPAPPTPESQSDQGTTEEYGTVIIENGDRTITFTSMPQRVIAANMAMTENLLLLGLEEYVVGRNVRTNPNEIPLPEIEEAFYAIPEIERSHELAVAAEADLMLGQISSFREDTWGSYEMFEAKGIHVYTISGTIVPDETIENVYTDIRALGQIFKVEDRAEALIAQAQEKVQGVAEAVKAVEEDQRLKVFVMDSFNGNEIYTTSKGLQSNLIELAGGINVTRNQADARWFNTSIETIVDTNPDVIIFNDYGTQTIEEKIDFIKNNEALKDVSAVKNENFVVIPLVEVMQDIRAAATCETIAKALYPDLF